MLHPSKGFISDPSLAGTLTDTDALVIIAAGLVALAFDSAVIQVVGLLLAAVVVVSAVSVASTTGARQRSVR